MWGRGKISEVVYDAVKQMPREVKIQAVSDSLPERTFKIDSKDFAMYGTKRENDTWRE